MRAHPDRKLLYLPHPRTASVATEQMLDGRGFVDPAPDLDKHAPLSDLTEHTGQDLTEWSVATTVRNHFDALVSWSFVEYASLPFGVDWLERFVESCVYATESALYPLHLTAADVLLRYEQLERDLSAWLSTDVELGRAHVSEGRNGREYQQFYDTPSRKWVQDRYGGEMNNLGYGWSR